MKLRFGQLEPDKAPHEQEGLQQADNVYPAPNGYRPIQAFEAITDALDEAFQGGATYVASDGTVNLVAGTGTDLYRYDSATLSWDSILTGLSAGRWYFTQFGDVAIGTHGGTPVAVDLAAGTAASLTGSPPAAALCMTVREFVVLGQADNEENKLAWSGFGNEAQWVNGTNQADEQPMLTGGAITGMAGGEYGLIFQRSQITRMTYVGVPGPIFQFDVISPNIGCITPGSIAQAGRLTFFLSDRGFYLTDGNDVKPIGNGRIDRTFLESYSSEDFDLMYATVDPKQSLVMWVMPGKAWIYDFALDKWSTSEQSLKAAFPGFTSGIDLDSLDALFPDLDAMEVSLDDGRFKGGAPLLLVVNSSDEVGTLTGENLEATFEQPYLELIEGRTARVSRIRPITDATDGISVRMMAKRRLGDTVASESFGDLEASGDIGIRVSGRVIKPTTVIAAGTSWSYAQGLEVAQLSAGGVR
jgi:hypothetical protein